MQFPVDSQDFAAQLQQLEHSDEAEKGTGFERRYKHVAKLNDSQKRCHNSWVLSSARAHQSHCLVLDGLNLFTSQTLIKGGIPVHHIHVPNKADYDAILAANHPAHGNLYRCHVLEWIQALVSLTPHVAADQSSNCIPTCNGIKTVWLDFTCRWSSHVERALMLLLSPLVMGTGFGDLFLTLNADTRCPAAMRADGARNFIREAVMKRGGIVDFPSDRCEEYGSGMFIMLAAVKWGSCDCSCSAGATLYERLRREARAFRKEQNSLKAKAD
jgi:hypothetical protein